MTGENVTSATTRLSISVTSERLDVRHLPSLWTMALSVSDTRSAPAKAAQVRDRLADTTARVGRSWPFIIAFLVFLAIWALANILLIVRAFDRYPVIFLNLVLSIEIKTMALHDKLDQLRNEQFAAILLRIDVLAKNIRAMQTDQAPPPERGRGHCRDLMRL